MSAYSAEMLDACSTVTLKVKLLPIFRCESVCSCTPSPKASTPSFWGLSGTSGGTEGQKHHNQDAAWIHTGSVSSSVISTGGRSFAQSGVTDRESDGNVTCYR